jgi:hypothetical protein
MGATPAAAETGRPVSTPQYPSLDPASAELVVSAPKDQTAVLHIVHGDFTPVLAKHSKSVCEAAIRSWQSGEAVHISYGSQH